MSENQPPVFPGWEEPYQQQAVETMPWFYPELDDDLRQALFSRQLAVRSITETVYQGTLDPLPRALFCVMQRAA
jgi:hypothetical protein